MNGRILSYGALAAACLSLVVMSGCRQRSAAERVVWDGSLSLPDVDSVANIGVAGAFGGIVNGNLLIAGGANFPDGFPWTGAEKVWHTTLYAYNFASGEWSVLPDFLPEPLGYGVSVTLPEGVMLIGGNNASGGSTAVRLLTEEGGVPVLRADSLPQLPFPLSNSAGAMAGNKIYLAGGIRSDRGERSSHTFLTLDLDRMDEGWRELPAWPGPELGFSVAAAAGGKFYLFGGRDFGPDKDTVVNTAGYVYDPVSGEWTQLDGEFPVMAATAVTIDDDIWFFGGVEKILPTDPDHPGFSHTLRHYTPSTGELAEVCESPFPLAVTTTAVPLPEERSVIITSGEVRPGVRTPLVLRCTIGAAD